jgi:hypothetical protein
MSLRLGGQGHHDHDDEEDEDEDGDWMEKVLHIDRSTTVGEGDAFDAGYGPSHEVA